jgi:hypothetical protein
MLEKHPRSMIGDKPIKCLLRISFLEKVLMLKTHQGLEIGNIL